MSGRTLLTSVVGLFFVLVLLVGIPRVHAVEPVVTMSRPHVHVFNGAALEFQIRDRSDCEDPDDVSTCSGIENLPLTLRVKAANDDSRTTVSIKNPNLRDVGDGSYRWETVFLHAGPHLITLVFGRGGETHVEPKLFEIFPAGWERMFYDATGDGTPDYAYQIRWEANATERSSEAVKLGIDVTLKRSINQPVNQEQPWMNEFDPLRPEDLSQFPEIRLMAGEPEEGTVVAELASDYVGFGTYQVRETVDPEELLTGENSSYWVEIRAVDDEGYELDSRGEPKEFQFPLDEVQEGRMVTDDPDASGNNE